MKKFLVFVTSHKFTPWLLLILTILSFGLMIPFMGYFMDDWYLIWFKHTYGALQYPAYFTFDRPLMGYFYIAVNALLFNSETPLIWHLFGLIMRWVCTLAIWQFLNTLWPKNNKQNTWVALLAAVFPGFLQHWIIVVYSFFYVCLAGLFFSFTLMIHAIRNKKRFWLYFLLSIIIGVYSFAAAEFYAGLELIRPVIIWVVLLELFPQRKLRIWQTLKYWSPYFVSFLGFALWRAFFFESTNHAVAITDQLFTSLGRVIIKTLSKLVQTIVDSTINTWTQPLNLANYPSFGKTGLSIIMLALIVFTALALWLRSQNRQPADTYTGSEDHWSKQSFWLGVVSLMVSILPFWAADLEVSTRYPYDRFLLAYLFGSCLLLASLINQFSQNQRLQIIFLSVLVAAGTAFQTNQMVRYKNLSDFQRNLVWQLVWRAPNLKPGTTVLANDFPNQDYLTGNAITTEVDWTYSEIQPPNKKGLDYLFVFLNSPTRDSIEELTPGKKIDYSFRGYQFHGSTDNTFLVGLKSNSCLRVLDNHLTPVFTVFYLYSKQVQDAAAISNLDLIIADTAQRTPPAYLFGSEPVHTWCYYFEKAELARQVNNYALAYSLVQQANQLGFYPEDATEWYPYIDSVLHEGHFEKAAELSNRIKVREHIVLAGVCHTWENYISSLPVDDADRVMAEAQYILLNCD